MNTGGALKKKRSKLETIIRQDHSDVYFDNEKLNEQLNRRITFMEKQMHQDDIQRGLEIGKLRREIEELRAIRTKSAEQQLQEIAKRPHTAAGVYRKETVQSKQRAQSAWGRTNSKPESTVTVEHTLDLSGDDEQLKTLYRADSFISEASTLRNPKTLRKYKVIDPNCFRENNKFPEDWYSKCLPASDAAIYTARKKVRGKSAPAGTGLLAKLRERERSDRKMMSFTKHKFTGNTQDNMTDASGIERMSLICEEPVKPILMSRRRIKELSNVSNVADRGPSRNTLRKQDLISKNEFEIKQIDDKVREFCKDIEELKARERIELKQREAERKKEAEERLYLQNINIEQLEKPEEKPNEDDDSDDEHFRKRWR